MKDEIISILDIEEDEIEFDYEEPVYEEFAQANIPEFKPAKLKEIKNVHELTNCPRCSKPLIPAESIAGTASTTFLECPNCGTLINTYKPTRYQARFLRSDKRYKMSAGGFGSGKSRTDIEDVIKHVLLIPNARVAVTGRTYNTLEATFVNEFYSMFPRSLLKSKNDMKHNLVLTNGSKIMFRSFDDPKKLKSMNLTMAVIVEASDVPYSGYTMLQSRIRNTAAMLPELDANGKVVMYRDSKSKELKIKYRIDVRHISLETNPDSGWVKTDFLLDAEVVEFFGDAYNEGYKFHKTRDKEKYVQVVSTSANPYLPPTYEEEQTRGKSKAYIAQFYKGSFNFSTNLVLPNFGICIKPPHPLPREFDEFGKRKLWFVIGVDYGISDPTHAVFGAFSEETRKLYIIGEYRVNNSDVKTIAKGYRRSIKENGIDVEGLLMLPHFDGRSYNKRESDLYTIGGAFEAQGLYFEPSFASMDARILKTNALINHDQLEVFSTCEFLIEEALNWKWKLDKDGAPTKKPVDKKDHGIQALNFITVELPHNLQQLRLQMFLPTGTEIVHDTKEKKKKKQNKVGVFNPLAMEEKDGRSSNVVSSSIVVNRGPGVNRFFGVSSPLYEEDEDADENGDFNGSLGSYVPSGRT